MKTNAKENQVQDIELDEVKKSRLAKFYSNPVNLWGSTISFLLLVIIVILLFLLCNGKDIKNELSLQTNLLKKGIAADSSYWNSMLQKVDSSLNLQNLSLKNQDTLKDISRKILNCCEKSNKQQSQILRELKGVRKDIDSIQYILVQVVQTPDTTKTVVEVVPEETVEKVLNVQMTKTTFDKKGNPVETKILRNYSAPVNFSSLTGFSKDNLNVNYAYLNENKNTSVLWCSGLVAGNALSLNVMQDQNTLFSEDKTFPFGKAGINFLKNSEPVEFGPVNQKVYELVFDQKKFSRGKWECIAGPIVAAAGGVGLGYFATNPSVTVNVYKGDDLIGEDKTYNVPMIITSSAAILGGIGLTIKGCLDKKLSWRLTPAEISFKYNLDNK